MFWCLCEGLNPDHEDTSLKWLCTKRYTLVPASVGSNTVYEKATGVHHLPRAIYSLES